MRVVLLAKEESPLARATRNRSPDEALHEVPSDRYAARRGGEGVVQHIHRLSLREGSPTTVAEEGEARTAPAGPAGRYLRGGGRADVEGRSRPSVHRRFRRDAQTPARTRGWDPADPGAANPRMARHPWGRAGGHLPAGPRARPNRIVGLHRHGRHRHHGGEGAVRSPALSLPARLFRLRARPCRAWRRELRRLGRGDAERLVGRSAARLGNIEPTASRPPSAISTWRPRRI